MSGGYGGGGAGGGSGIPLTIINAKGDLIAGLADNNPGIVSVGADGWVPVADSSQPGGIRWALPQASTLMPLFLPTNTQTPGAGTFTAPAPAVLNANMGVLDLTGYTQVAFAVLTPSQWDAGVKIRPQFSGDGGTTWNYFEAAGTALEMPADVNDSGLSLVRVSAYTAMTGAAQALIATRIALYGTITATSKGTKTAILAR